MSRKRISTENESKFSTLSDARIISHIQKGNIIISPFERENLNTSSYDVRLGRYYYREQQPEPGNLIYSPWSEPDVKRIWGESQEAVTAGDYKRGHNISLPEDIADSDRIILIPPGETILAHTEEFIGGRDGITTMMKARSSMGRNFIEVCKCAGWGDVGYINRWTMEITNNSRHYTIPLVVGRRVAQIVFFEVGQTIDPDYSSGGKYQTFAELKDLRANWRPKDMLPKMWKDREVEET